MQYQDLTHKIIGCAMKVHSSLGSGFQEVIYQRALAIEMNIQGLVYGREIEMQQTRNFTGSCYCTVALCAAHLRGVVDTVR